MNRLLVITYFFTLSTYIKSQSEYPVPYIICVEHNIQNTSADADT